MDVRNNSDVRIEALKKFGNERQNLTLGAYVCRFELGGHLSLGTFLGVDIRNFGAIVQHTFTPNVANTFLYKIYCPLYRNGRHAVDGYAMHSNSIMFADFAFIRTSFGFSYTHVDGHHIAIRYSRIPSFKLGTLEISTKAIIWSTPKHNSTQFYLLGNLSTHVNGVLKGNYRVGVGLGITHSF